MSCPKHDADLLQAPLFPLPNIVLFPRAVLPLHIFEERYKTMTAHVLAGDRLVAMALLKPGWEKNYYQKPEIEPIVCVGHILTWEKLPDGKYNFLLQGRYRAQITRELTGMPYRVAELTCLREHAALEIDLERERTQLLDLFTIGSLALLPTGRQFRELLGSPLPTADIADLLAFNFVEDVQLKQRLLGESNVRRRVGCLVDAISALSHHFNRGLHGFPTPPDTN